MVRLLPNALPVGFLVTPVVLWAQNRPLRPVPPDIVPTAEFQAAVAAGTRTTTGVPGSDYWQQWTDYEISAQLDVGAKRVEGTARIRYHNHSPDSLAAVYLHLLQNLHAPGVVRNEAQEVTGGMELARVVVNGRPVQEEGESDPRYGVQGTILEIRLAEPLASGDSLRLEIDFAFTVPQSGAGRMGWSRDNLFHVAYWYPQMAVYDDVVGWHLDPYLGNAEFHMGFGSYDLSVEVPAGWLVTATGRLTNADEVLRGPIVERFRAAHASDSVVHVVTAADLDAGGVTRTGDDGTLTWRFVSDTVRDVAFSAMRDSRWDAARTPVGDRDGDGDPDFARVDAFYRETAPLWRETWRYARHAVDFLSRWTGLSYPWPHMSAVEGEDIIGGGMEFPMVTLIGAYNERGDSALYYVTAHELAHMWVPMQIATDEKRRSWMDEGTTSFNENQARKEFYPGYDHDDPDRQTYLWVARRRLEGEIMRWSDYHHPGPAYGVASYSKPATVLVTLRALLGEERFRRAFTDYLRVWRYKHPKPWDFFNAFNEAAGERLDWFWRSWYYETWQLDQAVQSVESRDDGTVRIVIEDRGLVPMPVRLTIALEDGTMLHREIPVDHWLAGNRTAELTVETAAPVAWVAIDSERRFPDVNRENNVWRGEGE